MKKNLYADIHVLQTVPPSCINRDDMGRPKTAVYGGAERAIVSSQAWKHAMRVQMRENGVLETGLRTKQVKNKVAAAIAGKDYPADEADRMAGKVLELLFQFDKKKPDEIVTLFFISPQEVDRTAEIAIQYHTALKDNPDKKALEKLTKEYGDKLKKALSSDVSPDIRLFGRMFADDPDLNVDAAAQVAFAVSTHKVETETDFYSALDEVKEKPRAGYIDTKEFDSSLLYRYANVDAVQLCDTYHDSTPTVVREFVRAFVTSMPTGMMNSYANRNLPGYVCVCLRTDQPVNLVEAFEAPVRRSDSGFMQPSKEALKQYADNLYSVYGAPAAQIVCEIGAEGTLTWEALLDTVAVKVGELLGEGSK